MRKAIIVAALFAVFMSLMVSCGSTKPAAEAESPALRGKWYVETPLGNPSVCVEVVDMLSDDFGRAVTEALVSGGVDAVRATRDESGALIPDAGLMLVGRTMDLRITEQSVSLTVEFMLRSVSDGDPLAWFRISHSGADMEQVISSIAKSLAQEMTREMI